MNSAPVAVLPTQHRRGLLILSGVLLLLGIVGFTLIYSMVHANAGLAALDRPVFQDLLRQRNHGWTIFFAIISTLASPPWLASIVLISAGLWFLIRREWWRPTLWVGAMALGAASSNIIKHIVGRRRPPLADMATGVNHSFSFPSGHTLGMAIFILVLGYLLLSRSYRSGKLVLWLLAALVTIGLVALSRLYLGYHWLSDVSASLSVALVFLGLVILADVFRPKRADTLLRKSSKPVADSIARSESPVDTPDQR
ncbi:phosphatase PAP2 family protein [Psychromicrobium sp. YIM B11713]|uniref:phosphatase PAP2 family protein n=1 Tax=Psychromicrobium sp. YIM B11713 TaxID=3145233 RepID=UPI00374E9EC0